MDVFGSSGVRGVVGEDITPAFVARLAGAVGATWRDRGETRVALARDTRETGAMLAGAAAAGLAGAGLDVDSIGALPTPGAQAYADHEGVPAVVVTASHNPAAYNGLKVIAPDGGEADTDTLETVEARLEEPDTAAWDEVGRQRQVEGARRAYQESLLGAVDRGRVADAALTVAVDPAHGAGSLVTPAFLRALGCEVRTVNGQPDGRFPGRDPEPVPENLGDLRALVRATDADVGVAHDGDADRAAFVDETGTPVDTETSFAALAAADLGPGDTLVSAVNVSQRVVDAVEAAGADLTLTPIGSTHILSRVRELRAAGESVPVAGEGNGGVAFPPYRLARDGAYTTARFLELVAERSASGVAAAHGGYESARVNVGYDGEGARDRLLAAAEQHARGAEAAGADLRTVDGFRVDRDDSWVLVRPSGTEPLVRVYAEAPDRAAATALAEEYAETLRAAQ